MSKYNLKVKYHKVFRKNMNKIKIEELESDAEQAKNINQYDFCKKIKTNIEKTVVNEWGFDSSISINNSERSFSVLAVYLILDGHSVFCSFLNCTHHITKNCSFPYVYKIKNMPKKVKISRL